MSDAPSELLDLLRTQRDLMDQLFENYMSATGPAGYLTGQWTNPLTGETYAGGYLDYLTRSLLPGFEQGIAGQQSALSGMAARAGNLPDLTSRALDLVSGTPRLIPPSGITGTSALNPAGLSDIGLGPGQQSPRIGFTPTASEIGLDQLLTGRHAQDLEGLRARLPGGGRGGGRGGRGGGPFQGLFRQALRRFRGGP